MDPEEATPRVVRSKKLVLYLVESHWGPLVARVGRILLAHGPSTLRELRAEAGKYEYHSLDADKISHGLLILIHHNVVFVHLPAGRGQGKAGAEPADSAEINLRTLSRCKYELLPDEVLIRPRFGKFVKVAKSLFGDAAGWMVEALLLHGRATRPQLMSAAEDVARRHGGEVPSRASFAAAFRSLSGAGYVGRVEPLRSLYRTQLRAQQEAEAAAAAATARTSRGRGRRGGRAAAAAAAKTTRGRGRGRGGGAAAAGKAKAPRRARGSRVASSLLTSAVVPDGGGGEDMLEALDGDVAGSRAAAAAAAPVGGRTVGVSQEEGKDGEEEELDSDGEPVPGRSRKRPLPASGEEESPKRSTWGPSAADEGTLFRVHYGAFKRQMLRLAVRRYFAETVGPQASHVPDAIMELALESGNQANTGFVRPEDITRVLTGRGTTFGAKSVAEYVDTFLRVFSSRQRELLDTRPDPEGGGKRYTLLLDRVVSQLRERALDHIVQQRFGSKGLRLWRLLQQDKYLEAEQASKRALMPEAIARMLLHRLSQDGFVHVQEVPKRPDYAPTSTYFLYMVRRRLMKERVTDMLDGTMLHLMQRQQWEEERHTELVQRHESGLLTEDEQKPYDHWAEAMRRLYAAILHLDDTMMLMHDL